MYETKPDGKGATRFVCAAGVALLCAGCVDDAATTIDIAVDTLPNGAVHVLNPDPATDPRIPQWTFREDLRIGTIDRDGADLFADVRDILVDRAGHIYVLEFLSQEVRVFDSTGSHLFSFGGKGSGPGELRNANGLTWSPDGTMWLSDPANARYSVFRSDGTFVTSHRRDIGSYGFMWEGGLDSNGYLYDQSFKATGPTSVEPGVYRSQYQVFVRRLDPQAGTVDSFPAANHASPYVRTSNRGTTSVAFSGRLLLRFDPLGYVWSASTDTYYISQLRHPGDTLLVIERRYDPLPVTSDERDREVASIQRLAGPGRPGVDPSIIPDFKPAIENIDFDDHGRIWVRPVTDRDHTSFDVYGRDGRLIATATVDIAAIRFWDVEIVGNRLYTVVMDSLGVPYVVRARRVDAGS